MTKKHDHPKGVQYPKARELLPVSIEATDALEDSIFASAAGAYIRDVAHRPSVPDVEFEKIAKMAVHAAELFRKVQNQPPECEHKQTKTWEPHLAGARKCLDCQKVYNPNRTPKWDLED